MALQPNLKIKFNNIIYAISPCQFYLKFQFCWQIPKFHCNYGSIGHPVSCIPGRPSVRGCDVPAVCFAAPLLQLLLPPILGSLHGVIVLAPLPVLEVHLLGGHGGIGPGTRVLPLQADTVFLDVPSGGRLHDALQAMNMKCEEGRHFIDFFFEGLYFQENFIWKTSILKTRTIKSLKEEFIDIISDNFKYQVFSCMKKLICYTGQQESMKSIGYWILLKINSR